jgi:hypothetical protein
MIGKRLTINFGDKYPDSPIISKAVNKLKFTLVLNDKEGGRNKNTNKLILPEINITQRILTDETHTNTVSYRAENTDTDNQQNILKSPNRIKYSTTIITPKKTCKITPYVGPNELSNFETNKILKKKMIDDFNDKKKQSLQEARIKRMKTNRLTQKQKLLEAENEKLFHKLKNKNPVAQMHERLDMGTIKRKNYLIMEDPFLYINRTYGFNADIRNADSPLLKLFSKNLENISSILVNTNIK